MGRADAACKPRGFRAHPLPDACLVGRACAYGLAAMGEAGVERALRILEAEMMSTMALLGRCTPAELDRSALM